MCLTGRYTLQALPSRALEDHSDPNDALRFAFGVSSAVRVYGLLMHVPGHYMAWRLREDEAVLLDALRRDSVEWCCPLLFLEILRNPAYRLWQLADASPQEGMDRRAAALSARGGTFGAPVGVWQDGSFVYGHAGESSEAKRPRIDSAC